MEKEISIQHHIFNNRDLWPEGLWKEEPNFEVGTYKGYRYVIDRKMFGYLCGYVEIPKGQTRSILKKSKPFQNRKNNDLEK